MAIKLSDALQRVKAGIADLEEPDISPQWEMLPNRRPTTTMLKLTDIVVPPERIRQYFDGEKTASLTRSIEQYGFRGVLWVRSVRGQYYLVAGGRRYVACQRAGVQEVPVEIWDISDAEAIQLELLENFQREDLNPVEETEGVLRMLEVTLNLPRSEVIALLNWKARQQREQNENGKLTDDTDNVIRSSNSASGSAKNLETNTDRWQAVEAIFRVIGKFSPESFRTNRLPLLNLPEPILEAICSGKIEYTKARLIGRVKDAAKREALLQEAIDQGLSHGEITARVRQIQAESITDSLQQEQHEFRSRANQVMKRLRMAKLNQRSLMKAEKLLSELEALL